MGVLASSLHKYSRYAIIQRRRMMSARRQIPFYCTGLRAICQSFVRESSGLLKRLSQASMAHWLNGEGVLSFFLQPVAYFLIATYSKKRIVSLLLEDRTHGD